MKLAKEGKAYIHERCTTGELMFPEIPGVSKAQLNSVLTNPMFAGAIKSFQASMEKDIVEIVERILSDYVDAEN